MLDDLKDMIEKILGDCNSVEEICETYAEIYSFTKQKMKETCSVFFED